ncbi:MAG TPA: ATP-binding cassette domain-containing protein [Candidatus Copromorpha excrementipullorum]|uniref:ATP-binding cassette domain-containing protein n=1 Tax=Candidatus Allocopromorpha excrementipullorum TaxID=2840743 RepID=A0A9D1N4P3_9FIRM|nr:ATP-binding cassette domain-containing protein [Candidatus Copromorpha excrementipullorum]
MEVFEIKNMTFTYAGASRPAIKDISLRIEPGEMMTVCGKSGSGKSTLLRHMKPALAPVGEISGSLTFCGRNIRELSHEEQASRIGYVLQNPDNQIVTDKVWHELAFGLESLGEDTATIRLRVAEMASYFGIQAWFHKDVAELSGGQKQLLNLASVMVMQPDVLILDEPTSQLDPIAAEEFLDTVRKINRELGTTVLLAEHRLEQVVTMSDRVVVLDDGRIIADDAPANVGAILAVKGHPMFMAMPTPMQAYGHLYQCGIGREEACPTDVREGRNWLTALMKGKRITEVSLPDVEPQENGSPVIEMKDIWFRYSRDENDVLRDFSLSINRGELLCMVGGNGAGKTTALNIMGGIRKHYRGAVKISGKTGILPQNPQTVFVEKTLSRDLMEVLEGHPLSGSEREKKVREMTELLEIDGLLDMHPYDLSGGEQQRAALAKVLLLEPDILLLDEPTKGLDPDFKEKLAGILTRLIEGGMTIVMASHDIEFCCRHADRCAMVFDGKVISCGAPRRFFSGNSFYTTAANRMSRHIFENAVNVEDLIRLVKNNLGEGSKVTLKENDSFGEKVENMSSNGGYGIVMKDPKAKYMQGDLPGGKISDSRRSSNEKRESKADERRTISLLTIDVVMMALALGTVFAGIYIFDNQRYFIVSMLLVIYAMVPFFARFERSSPKAREIVILAVMISVAVAGRAAFFMVPNFKPTVAIIIIAGVALGRQAGFLTGAMSAFVSNFLFGQGPWTTWQMLAMAVIGYLAGAVFYRYGDRMKVVVLAVFGGAATFFIYGAITDMWTILMMTSQPSLATAMVVYGAAVPFNAVHAAATVIFLLLLAKPMVEKLNRVKVKYGMGRADDIRR